MCAVKCPSKKQKGFSLIEVLVAVVIFAVGFLGLASLQSLALKRNIEADYRTKALLLANDLIESARVLCATSTCNISANMFDATGDYDTWNERVKSELPNGSATVEYGTDSISVQLYWSEVVARSESAGEKSSFQVRGRIRQ